MNQEQRQIVFEQIRKLEGLLAYAVKNCESNEAERIRNELRELIDAI